MDPLPGQNETENGLKSPLDDAPASTTLSKNNPSASDLTATVRTTTDRILTFLSTASNETLGACIVGLGATTYLVLGRVGLLLIGAVGGVVLHATWEKGGQQELDKLTEQARRREVGLDIAQRVLAWRSSRSDTPDEATLLGQSADDPQDFSHLPPETASALNTLTDAVIRDYVKWWWSPILPTEEAFPLAARETFATFLLSISNNIARKRPADSFLEFVTNSASILVVFLNELSSAVWATPSASVADSIESYLQSKPDSNLANITDPKQQERKLLAIADDICSMHLNSKVYACNPAKVFLRQTLARLVLDNVLWKCSQSDWINDWIVFLLEEPDTALASALEAEVGEAIQHELKQEDKNTNPAQATADEIEANHKRTRGRAEEAMEEAMREAQRLTQLMAEEDLKRNSTLGTITPLEDVSDTNTQGMQTPTSSESETQSAANDTAVSETTEQTTPISPSTHDEQAESQRLPTALLDYDGPPPGRREVLTLHKASVSIFDDATAADKKPLKAKPTIEYMIQIEPANSNFPGWMIPRKYDDFAPLHEVLRRISTISGAVSFTEAHAQLPGWKGRTKSQLTQDLDRYLNDAIEFEPLAESEGMKRFLDKERGMKKQPRPKSGFGAFETMGKGVIDAIAKAPKNVAGAGKAVFTGMAGTPGSAQGPKLAATHGLNNASMSSFGQSPSSSSFNNGPLDSALDSRASFDSSRTSTSETPQPKQLKTILTTPRAQTGLDTVVNELKVNGTIVSGVDSPLKTSSPSTPQMNLPPPPSDIPDDYMLKEGSLPAALQTKPALMVNPVASRSTSPSGADAQKAGRARRPEKEKLPLNEKETQVTVELLFAVVQELYTLSSAWTLRRTLLNAAKSYLLRPGNPQLESIRVLMQETVLDANTSDAGIAAHILTIRANSLPTPEELAKWPRPRTDEEKELLRTKARRLIVKKGMPQALTSVMGMAASGEAMGRVFDALQDERVAKGLMFALLLQAVRAGTQ